MLKSERPHSHFAIQFAKGLGCEEVVAFSHSSRKKEDAIKLGATRFVETGKKGFEEPLHASLDLIIVSTATLVCFEVIAQLTAACDWYPC